MLRGGTEIFIMRINLIGNPKIIMQNPYGKDNYFGWPSIARLQNGKIAVVASGYRYAHICPFGKAVISYSEDNGETFTIPAPVINTPLDDRDAGILAFGENGVIVTSFNNSIEFQRNTAKDAKNGTWEFANKCYSLAEAYLDILTPEDEEKYLGSEFRISRDCGTTFGELYKSPITSPHGPTELHDGTLLWVGRTFSAADAFRGEAEGVHAYKINPENGSMEFVGAVPPVYYDGKLVMSCEPHAIELDDGTILCHIRVQGDNGLFTIYQSESEDGGKTWSEPRRLLEHSGGAPAHLLKHSSGVLISTYGYRNEPYGIKAMFSRDNGKTWDIGYDIFSGAPNYDLGYPCSIELEDKTIMTVFYAHESADAPKTIMCQAWSFEVR